AGEAVDLLDSGGRGHVDLGKVVADHVDADEDEAAFLERRADRFADQLLARRELGFPRGAAGMEIRARLALLRHARDGASRLAVHQDDALVALPDLGDVALRDDRLAEHLREYFEDGAQI